MVLQPGNVWVIEYPVKEDEETLPLIHTCQMRGWVELLHEPLPMGNLNEDGGFNRDMPFHTKTPIWRLTDTGWAVIQRRHFYTVLGVIVAIASAVVTIA